MKIYVDEIPKCCKECRFYALQWCHAVEKEKGTMFISYDKSKDKNNLCPLETTQSIKQQVREEVVEQVNDYMKKHSHTIPVISKNRRVVYNIGLTRFLDQVKGETK